MTQRRFPKIHIIALACIFLQFCNFSNAALPKIIQVPHHDIESGFQDWAIAQDSMRRIYVGNQEGLLRYDGENWHGYYLPNQSAIHAIQCRKDSIFVGGFDEFGFFMPIREGGPIIYKSLSDNIKSSIRNITEIKNICQQNDNLWFQSDYWLFKFDGSGTTASQSPKRLTAMANYRGHIILGTGRDGLLLFENGNFNSIGNELLGGKFIVDLVVTDDDLLIVTRDHGLYTLSPRLELSQISSPADAFLLNGNISKAAIDASQFAFASLNKGVIVYDSANGQVKNIKMREGLPSNTVYTVFFDAEHNLWTGGDEGLSLIVLNSPISKISSDSQRIGIGYEALQLHGTTYLATSQGLFYISADGTAQPETRLKGYQPPVMCLAVSGDELIVGTNDGLHILGPSGSEKIDGVPGALCARPLRSDNSTMIVSTIDNFYLLKKEGGHWVSHGKIAGYNDVNGRFEEDASGNFWISHWLKGVFRLRLSPDLTRFAHVDLFDRKDGFPDKAGNTLTKINGEIAFSTRDGIYTFDKSKGIFAPDPQFASIPVSPSAMLLTTPDHTSLSISPDDIIVTKTDNSGAFRADSSSFRQILPDLLPGYINMYAADDGDLIVSSREGFYILDPYFKTMPPADSPNLIIDAVTVRGDSLIYSSSHNNPKEVIINYDENDLRFDVAFPEYRNSDAVYYSFMLEGYDREWSHYTRNSSKEYTKLPEGTYTLKIRAINKYDNRTYETSLNFTVRPPWYRSNLAKVIYLLLILAAIAGIFLIGKRLATRAVERTKAREKARMEKIRQEAEAQMLKDQYELEKVAREKVEYSIRVKSEELSNTTMNVIRKNELLKSIIHKMKSSEDLLAEKGYTTEVKKTFNNIRKLINDNIEHDDDWKKFTDNFDIVYDNFAKRLVEQYPTLTKSEVKICCYIKMGLSSKEISSIFNLSVRSIEMYRYQIRPKLGLGREDRLSSFLEKF